MNPPAPARPDPEAVLTALSALLCRLCAQDYLDLSAGTKLEEIPGLDSLRALQAVALLEEQFQVEVEIMALDQMHTVGDLVSVLAAARPALPGHQQ